MAKALIIDDNYGQLVQRYYRRFPEEPVSQGITIDVEQPERVAKMSLDTLLQAIIGAWNNKTFVGPDLVLVSHGNERGLTMRLFPGHRTDSRTDSLEVLISGDDLAEVAKKLYVTEKQAQSLLDKIDQVRSLGIGYIEFRGCTIGAQERNIRVLKDLFTSVSVSGPDLLSTYGEVPVEIMRTDKQMDVWLKRYPGSHVYGAAAGRVAFHSRKAGSVSILHAAAESRDAVPQWIAAKMTNYGPDSFEGWMQKALPVHYMTFTPPIMPLEGDYLDHLTRVR